MKIDELGFFQIRICFSSTAPACPQMEAQSYSRFLFVILIFPIFPIDNTSMSSRCQSIIPACNILRMRCKIQQYVASQHPQILSKIYLEFKNILSLKIFCSNQNHLGFYIQPVKCDPQCDMARCVPDSGIKFRQGK